MMSPALLGGWERFYGHVCAGTGLDLSQYKAEPIQRRIRCMMEAGRCPDLEAFWDRISSGDDQLANFLDRLVINVSELFRDPDRWSEMERKVIPELLSRSPTLRVWSAGCSYGAEAHSLAMLLDAKFGGNHSILGSDIDRTALDQARRGEFLDSDMKAVPSILRHRYFMLDDRKWIARPEVKRHLKFEFHNLLEEPIGRGFDLIMCRNVVIYLTEEAADRLFQALFAALKPGGILFVGTAERVGRSGEIGFESHFPCFYRKPLAVSGRHRCAA